MTTQILHYEDEGGDLVDVDYCCSRLCLHFALERLGVPASTWDREQGFTIGSRLPDGPGRHLSWGGWPCPDWPDYQVDCLGCGRRLHEDPADTAAAVEDALVSDVLTAWEEACDGVPADVVLRAAVRLSEALRVPGAALAVLGLEVDA